MKFGFLAGLRWSALMVRFHKRHHAGIIATNVGKRNFENEARLKIGKVRVGGVRFNYKAEKKDGSLIYRITETDMYKMIDERELSKVAEDIAWRIIYEIAKEEGPSFIRRGNLARRGAERISRFIGGLTRELPDGKEITINHPRLAFAPGLPRPHVLGKRESLEDRNLQEAVEVDYLAYQPVERAQVLLKRCIDKLTRIKLDNNLNAKEVQLTVRLEPWKKPLNIEFIS